MVDRQIAFLAGKQIRTSERPGEDHPAIVLNEYGEGKTVFFAFDLGLTLDEGNYDQLSAMIRSSITYVHKEADTGSFMPGRFAPIETKFESRSSPFDAELRLTYPPDLRIFDPKARRWVSDNPWTINIHIDPRLSKTFLSYALTPDKADDYMLLTETGYMIDGLYNFQKSLTTDILVSQDRETAAREIVTALKLRRHLVELRHKPSPRLVCVRRRRPVSRARP